MLPVYNFLLTALLLLSLPVTIPLVLVRKKYRGRTLERLGLRPGGVQQDLHRIRSSRIGPSIWIHALSVGEVTSALPLVKAIRRELPDSALFFTAATSSGRRLADTIIRPHVDLVCSGPFDLRFVIKKYLAMFRPDLFILVETDFWPNWLHLLRQASVPAMLVNGRISTRSFAAYRRWWFFFRPLFNNFTILSMQTASDGRKLAELGIGQEKIMTLGNLKYDMETEGPETATISRAELGIAEKQQVWVCGSTHPGEEEILFAAFSHLGATRDLFLILASRDIGRAAELTDLARAHGLAAAPRTSGKKEGKILLLDTIGELAACYGLADIAFVGGSLVEEGGHNPIEPAVCGVPVLFGPHMEDFAEIAEDLVQCDGARTVTAETLARTVARILDRPEKQKTMGRAARELVTRHRGGVHQHLQVIRRLCSGSAPD